MAALTEEEAPRARLDAVRAALGSHEDDPVEQLVRQQRDERTRKLAGLTGVARRRYPSGRSARCTFSSNLEPDQRQ
ncbi:MAG: hypothetical protein OXF79_30280 [Chloroflexi bacterium]|nr:hypothetical protein [Chloroflexota bacterium]